MLVVVVVPAPTTTAAPSNARTDSEIQGKWCPASTITEGGHILIIMDAFLVAADLSNMRRDSKLGTSKVVREEAEAI